jgi:hypothetical protein
VHSPNIAIDAALFDVDGSCCDVNFDRATWPGIRSLVERTRPEFGDVRVGSTSHDADDLQLVDVNVAFDLVERTGGFVQIVLDGGVSVLRHLQIFASCGPGEPPSVELSFFPQDVVPRPNPQGPFVAWMDAIANTLGATCYLVRYEGVSWGFGDVSPQAGVFLVRRLSMENT